jgi:hypothetical protein
MTAMSLAACSVHDTKPPSEGVGEAEQPIVGGVTCKANDTGKEHNPVVAIVQSRMVDGIEVKKRSSATLIYANDKDKIACGLTAAHICDRGTDFDLKAGDEVDVGNDLTAANLIKYKVSAKAAPKPHDKWDRTPPAYDFCMFVVDTDGQAPTVPVASDPAKDGLAAGTKLTLVGWGLTDPTGAPPQTCVTTSTTGPSRRSSISPLRRSSSCGRAWTTRVRAPATAGLPRSPTRPPRRLWVSSRPTRVRAALAKTSSHSGGGRRPSTIRMATTSSESMSPPIACPSRGAARAAVPAPPPASGARAA